MLANHIGGVMVGMLYCDRSLVQIRLVKLSCCFSAKHAALKRKDKDVLAVKQDNASQWTYTIVYPQTEQAL